MDFLEDFGVKPVLLIAQVVNFLILLFILKRFLYKPILKVLEERKKKIAESLKNASEIEKKLEQITEDREKKLQKAAKEAEEIIKEATENADKIITQAHEKAGKDIEKILAKTENEMELEREKLKQEIRAELAHLVELGLKKVSGKVITQKEHKELVEKSVKDLM